ncbi:MAG: beta-galactosidase trimerization domain-containing protein [Chloroflexi bacterium]|nr:beta-galactosidase trimerization domain-containing protein [Chloroflexota bacterium]
MPSELRFRQVHLDFHTSEQIAGIGAAFDPDVFAGTLARARVDSITCFARCHHGWLYYDSVLNPERRHPHLRTDLLRRQIEACHAHDIRVPIYITVQWDHFSANAHPEWLAIDDQGRPFGTPPFEAGFYRRLCVNSPYRDFLKAHTREVLETLPVDGLFFDIVHPLPCACRHCRAAMVALGMDPANLADRQAYGQRMIDDFKREMTAFVRQFNSECTIFYNAGHVGTRDRATAAAYTHWELESLPSGGWGYLHFPVAQRYARTLGHECLGMTGKFHTSWGDFHSFQNQAALEYECFRMLALGAKCSIGDQLPPSGAIEPVVYDLIGAVYRRVEQKEPWCRGARPLNDIAVLSPEEFAGPEGGRVPQATMGVERILDEGGHQFDIVDSHADFSAYKLVILPDTIPVAPALAARLEEYLAAGGALIASFESGLAPDKRRFALAALGVELAGEGPRDAQGRLVRGRHFPAGDYVEYLRPGPAIGAGMPLTEHVMYMRGLEVRAAADADVLADTVASFFDRTYQHFCSHRQTPSSGITRGPAIVRRGSAIYFSQPVFSQYAQNAPRWCKRLVLNAIALLLPEPLLRHDGPGTLFATLMEQPAEHRRVIHLLHYVPERRGMDFDVIEDVIPLHNLRVSVLAPVGVRRVVTAPEGVELPFQIAQGRVSFTLPLLNGHQMVALEW